MHRKIEEGGNKMKVSKHRINRTFKAVSEELSLAESQLASEAIKCIGKELNTQKAWELKGRVEALKEVKGFACDENLDEGFYLQKGKRNETI